MRRWSAGARWRDARDAADRDRTRLRAMFTNAAPIEVEAPVGSVPGSVWELLVRRIEEIGVQWSPIEWVPLMEQVREASHRIPGLPGEELDIPETAYRPGGSIQWGRGGWITHHDVSQNVGGFRHHIDPGPYGDRHEPEVIRTPWREDYGPVVSWPDEGYPCQVCWAVGRWPWEPLRATPVGVDPDDYACEAHCPRCVVPRQCSRHRRVAERRVRVAAADKPRPRRPVVSGYGRGLMQPIPPMWTRVPGWRCCPEQEIVESVRFQEHCYTRVRCGSCGSTWHVSDEYLAAVE